MSYKNLPIPAFSKQATQMNTITKQIISASELDKSLPASHVHVPIVFKKFWQNAREQSKSEPCLKCLDLLMPGMNGYISIIIMLARTMNIAACIINMTF